MALKNNWLKIALLRVIRWYQGNFSPDHSAYSAGHQHGYCRFWPSCSEYTHQAVYKYGIIKGLRKGIWRILRCHPFARGGYDPVK